MEYIIRVVVQAFSLLFRALNVPYRIIELLHTNRHRELLSTSCGFDSRWERYVFFNVFATMVSYSLLLFLYEISEIIMKEEGFVRA